MIPRAWAKYFGIPNSIFGSDILALLTPETGGYTFWNTQDTDMATLNYPFRASKYWKPGVYFLGHPGIQMWLLWCVSCRARRPIPAPPATHVLVAHIMKTDSRKCETTIIISIPMMRMVVFVILINHKRESEKYFWGQIWLELSLQKLRFDHQCLFSFAFFDSSTYITIRTNLKWILRGQTWRFITAWLN